MSQNTPGGVRYMDPKRNPKCYPSTAENDTLTQKDPKLQPSHQKALGERCHYPKKVNPINDFDPKEEMEDWIPTEAYSMAHDFRNRCASNISQSLMNQLLHDLNKIWYQREQNQIQKIKTECNHEVQFIRRQLQTKKPYDQHMHEQDIRRLKNDVKSAQQALRENVAVISQEQKGPNKGLHLVDQTVKYTN